MASEHEAESPFTAPAHAPAFASRPRSSRSVTLSGVRMRRLRALGLFAMATALAGCSLLVHFNDEPPCADGGCVDAPAGDTSPAFDGGSDAPADPCAALPEGTLCAYTGGCQCQYCAGGVCSQSKACPQGFNWEAGVDVARCCNGLPVLTNTNANCGVCGVACATAGVTSPQDCQLLGGHYQCVDCAANNECWSGCCAIDTTPYHCSASNCNTGACPSGLCPAPSTCVEGVSAPNYCTYD